LAQAYLDAAGVGTGQRNGRVRDVNRVSGAGTYNQEPSLFAAG